MKSVTKRPCLFCRKNGKHSLKVGVGKGSSCAASLCTIFGLPHNHLFKTIFEQCSFCERCFLEVREADMALGKLQVLRQNLLRFQNNIYGRLGMNYFAIKDVESIEVSYKDFDIVGKVVKGRKLAYEDIVKAIYEKLDAVSSKWERFSSDGIPDPSFVSHQHNEVNSNSGPGALEVSGGTDPTDKSNADGSKTTENETDSNMEIATTTTVDNEDVDPPIIITLCRSEQPVSFSKAPSDFAESNKIYCTFDPDNCTRFFYDDYNLQVHIRSYHLGNAKPHECTLCSKCFIEEGRLKTHHARVHLPTRACICEHCGKEFNTKNLLQQHIRRTHKKPTHPCQYCGAKFDDLKYLEDHLALHRSKEAPFSCVFCSEVFSQSAALKTHFKKHIKGAFECDLCDQSFSNESSLKCHHTQTHTKKFECKRCHLTFPSASGLSSHMLSHSSEKLHTCEVCGAAFKYIKNLNSHSKSHSDTKSYTCEICKATFKELSYLRRHEESHSIVPNYTCSKCGKAFKVKESFKKHMTEHEGASQNMKRKSDSESSTSEPIRKTRDKRIKRDNLDSTGEGSRSCSQNSKQAPSLRKKSRKPVLEAASIILEDLTVEEDNIITYECHTEEVVTAEEEVNRAIASIQVDSSQQPVVIHSIAEGQPHMVMQFHTSSDASNEGIIFITQVGNQQSESQESEIQFQY